MSLNGNYKIIQDGSRPRRIHRFLNANKNRSEHLVKTSPSSQAPTDMKKWQDPPTPPPPSSSHTTSSSFNVQKALVCVIASQKAGPGRADETKSSVRGLCFISEDLVTTRRAGWGGGAESRLGGNVYAGNKDCDNCDPLRLERHYTVLDSQTDSGNTIQIGEGDRGSGKQERRPNVRARATGPEESHIFRFPH